MFTMLPMGADAPTVPPAKKKPTTYAEPVRLMLFGSPGGVRATIKDIHRQWLR